MKIHDHVSSHNSFMYLWILGALVVLGGLVYSYIGTHPDGVLDGEHEGDVRAVVSAFGNNLNNVSLLSPDAVSDIERAYSPYVAPELLQVWLTDTVKAPGRTTSSPWPDHIEVDTVTMTAPGIYEVRGRIMLITSTGDAGIIPVALTVTAYNGSYLITAYAQGTDIDDPKVETIATSTVTVSAKLGETVSALGIMLTPQTLEEESRCPTDVTCIQAGTVRVKILTEDGMGTSTSLLTLNGPVITTETVSITLTDAQPAPIAAAKPDPAAYLFTFRVDAR